MAKLLRLFIIAFFLICNQSAADEIVPDFEMGDLPFYLITASDARSVIVENIKVEVYRNDFETMTRYDSEKIGILNMNNSICQASYSYYPWFISCSIWYPDRNVFLASSHGKSEVEEMIQILLTYEESEYDLSNYQIDEQLQLEAAIRAVQRYVDYIQNINMYATHREELRIDYESVLLNMDDYWGITISPDLPGEVRMEYEFGPDMLEVEIYYNDILLETAFAQVDNGTQGEREGQVIF